ncbi:MAG: hypothetical protein U0R64_09230 [Candidatus Nanopelagicales bacterium]
MAEDSQDEVQRLQHEVEELQEQLAEAESHATAPVAKEPRHRMRSFWSAVLIIVACILAPLSVVAVWAKGEVTDTDRYVATVAPLASDADIQAAVSTRVTDEILTAIDLPAVTQEAIATITENRNLDPRKQAALEALAGPLDSGIESFIGSEVTKVVQSQQFAQLWTQANTKLHEQLNLALSGQDSGAVELQGDEVVLDVGDVVTEVKNALVAKGFTVAEKIPAVDTSIVLFQSQSLAKAQTAYSMLNTLGMWLPIVTFALGLLGVFVAKSPRRALLGFGIGLTIAMVVSGIAYQIGRADVLANLPADSSTAAATTLLDTVSYFLRQALWAGAVAGVVLILTAIMIGPSRFAVGVRGLCKRAAAAIQRQLASWGATMNSARSFVANQATGLRIAAAIIAVGFVLIQHYKTPGLIVWTTVALLVVLFIIQIFASGSDDDEILEVDVEVDVVAKA